MSNHLYDALFGRHADSASPFLRLADGTTISHMAFLRMAAQFAHALTDPNNGLAMTPGDRLAAQVSKSPEALALYAACAQAGIVFLPLNTAYTPDEMRYFLEDSAAAALICDPQKAPALSPIAQTLGAKLETLDAAGAGGFTIRAQAMPPDFPTAACGRDDLAALLYTSGTTGRSKGAMLSHGNLLSNAEALAACWRFTEADTLLHALPIFHTHGLFVATNTVLAAGASMILLPRFDLDEIFALLPQVTTLMGVPTFYTRLLDDTRLTRDACRHMRLFISGSAPLTAETHARFAERAGHRILERYGMTETNMNTSNPYDGERRAGSVGMPLPGVEARITDADTGAPLPQGEVGRIEVRGPNVFRGYWRMPEKTAAEMREDGFFITGDLGRFDEDGYLHIVGRDKDLIISGGYNIYPKEIEMILDAQPGVLESAVIGVAHPDFGETPLALIVAEPAETPDLEAAAQAVAATLARFKHPRKLVLVDALPRNAMGKVEKNRLRAEFADMFS